MHVHKVATMYAQNEMNQIRAENQNLQKLVKAKDETCPEEGGEGEREGVGEGGSENGECAPECPDASPTPSTEATCSDTAQAQAQTVSSAI